MMRRPRQTKAQTAYEFLFMFFFLTAAFTTWMVLTAQAKERITMQREADSLEDLGLSLQEELYTAQQMPDGFTRTITLPPTLAGRTYRLDIYREASTHTVVAIDNGRYTATYTLPHVQTPYTPYDANRTITINKTAGTLLVTSPGGAP